MPHATTQDARHIPASYLREVGIRRLFPLAKHPEEDEFGCLSCGEQWMPKTTDAARQDLVEGWWQCPRGCNADVRQVAAFVPVRGSRGKEWIRNPLRW